MKKIGYIFAITAFVVVMAIYFSFDPEQFEWMPKCVFHEITGLKCPGCGSQRMLHSLLHGNVGLAWHHNALALCLIPVLIPMAWLEIERKRFPGLYAKVHSLAVILTLTLLIIAWGIFRNL